MPDSRPWRWKILIWKRFLAREVVLIESGLSPATKWPFDGCFDPNSAMKRTGKCPKCGSLNIIADAKAVDRGDGNYPMDMSLATFGKPDALIFKDKKETTVSAWVCADCGFTEYYADHPSRLK
jgi:predicted nucleic-acid-binding Zn-ribbon protein